MKINWKWIGLLVGILLFWSGAALPARAQQVQVKVEVVGEDDPVSQNIANQVSGKIGSSARYALVKTEPDIVFGIMCGNVTSGWIVCSTEVTYYTIPMFPTDLGRRLDMHAPEQMSEDVFDSFVEDTTPDSLASAKTRARATIDAIKQGECPNKASSQEKSMTRKRDGESAVTA